ncbi:MAG: hypothetical protein IT211_09245 [Armatimonadetes bacterium]|nr:hypothetical protein [Armatimonadota bacterium]
MDTLDPMPVGDYCALIRNAIKDIISPSYLIEIKILALSKYAINSEHNDSEQNWTVQLDSGSVEYQKKHVYDSMRVALLWISYCVDNKIEWALNVPIWGEDGIFTVLGGYRRYNLMLQRYSKSPTNADVFKFLQYVSELTQGVKIAFKDIRHKKSHPCFVRINTWNKYVQKFTYRK